MTTKIVLPQQLKLVNFNNVHGSVSIPSSKSITNRAIIIAMLANGCSCLNNILESDDTDVLIQLIKNLKINFEIQTNELQGTNLKIEGVNGKLPSYNQTIFIKNAGTAARFLCSILSLGIGQYVIDGDERMRLRPINDLLIALASQKINIKSILNNGYLPIQISASKMIGGVININADKSSQYISSLMLSAPYSVTDSIINVGEQPVSKPYIEMTLKMMQSFGAAVSFESTQIKVSNKQQYQAQDYLIEADFSSASYFIALPLICFGSIKLLNLKKSGLQGDELILDIVTKMGANVSWQNEILEISSYKPLINIGSIDLFNASDLVPTIAVLAAITPGQTHITNVANVRIKESDRLHALATELSKLGIKVNELKDGLIIHGKAKIELNNEVIINTYNDHRIAMSFSLLALTNDKIIIDNPSCVTKTFPNFYNLLLNLNSPK